MTAPEGLHTSFMPGSSMQLVECREAHTILVCDASVEYDVSRNEGSRRRAGMCVTSKLSKWPSICLSQGGVARNVLSNHAASAYWLSGSFL